MERLRALELEKKKYAATNEDGFVEVFGSDDDHGPIDEKVLGTLRRAPTTLDVDQLEGWQAKLLQDPKNRSVRVSVPDRHSSLSMPCHLT